MNNAIQAISNCYASPITWSRDSLKIAYVSGCNGQGEASELWMLHLQHPAPIRLMDGGYIVSL